MYHELFASVCKGLHVRANEHAGDAVTISAWPPGGPFCQRQRPALRQRISLHGGSEIFRCWTNIQRYSKNIQRISKESKISLSDVGKLRRFIELFSFLIPGEVTKEASRIFTGKGSDFQTLGRQTPANVGWGVPKPKASIVVERTACRAIHGPYIGHKWVTKIMN